jgi:hypothetical protein
MKRHSNAKYHPSDDEILKMWEMFCQGLGDHEISKKTGYSTNVVIACLAQVSPDGRIMDDAYGGMSPDERPKERRIVNPFGESPDAVRKEMKK